MDIVKTSKTFIENIKLSIQHVHPSLIINTDQSGFCYEYYSQRTLSNCGEKSTILMVNSMYAISHRYTIQPIITMNGDLLPKMLICLQEVTGEFGPRVSNDLPNYLNIIIKCSKSGKLTKDLVIEFNQELIKPLFNSEFIYIADSWNGQTDQEIYENVN